MKPVCLHAKEEIELFLRQNTFLHLYEIGDLDEFFWQYTTWYALKEHQEIFELVLLYTGASMPILLALTSEPTGLMEELLRSIIHLLPKQELVTMSYSIKLYNFDV